MRNILFVVAIVLVAGGCRQRYEAGITYPKTGYLVVEGFINSGQGSTTFRLSRTVKINDTANLVNERGARVMVQGEDNSSVTMTETAPGTYSISQVPIQNSKKYRLRIITSQGKEYVSDFVTPIKTPPIDTISLTKESNGIQLNIDTHDPLNNTKYYSWYYEETWEFRAKYYRSLKYFRDIRGVIRGVVFIKPDHTYDSTVFRCWQFNNSTSIIIGSTAKLSQDIIHMPLIFIDQDSWKISVLYTVKLYQHSLSPNGYEFLKRMKKNTEQVGSIFDSQPSDLNSNIHCTTQPLEPVIGYIDVAEAQEKRLWLTPTDVAPWNYDLFCETAVWNSGMNLDSLYNQKPMIPTNPFNLDFQVATPICVDCTLRGFNNKPSYWPN